MLANRQKIKHGIIFSAHLDVDAVRAISYGYSAINCPISGVKRASSGAMVVGDSDR